MYHEKWGFMLIFWNFAGVPLSYCHCSLYMANHAPSQYSWSRPALAMFYITYLVVYWVWDTANSQKNRFRQQERGTPIERRAFPQLPWQTVKNPYVIRTQAGESILADGWCKCTLAQASAGWHFNGSRWLCAQNPLYCGPDFCSVVGADHGIQKPAAMVLSRVLCDHDQSPSVSRYQEMRGEIRRGLARVQASSTVSLHSSKSFVKYLTRGGANHRVVCILGKVMYLYTPLYRLESLYICLALSWFSKDVGVCRET